MSTHQYFAFVDHARTVLVFLATALCIATLPSQLRAKADFLPPEHLIGVNYIQIDPRTHRHSLARDLNIDMIDRDFGEISADGFNVVRIFVEAEAYPHRAGPVEKTDAITDNIYKILRMAKTHNLSVILTFEHWIPQDYMDGIDISRLPIPLTDSKGLNSNAFLFDHTLAVAHAKAIAELIASVESRAQDDHISLTNLFAIDISNELAFDIDRAPFATTDKQPKDPVLIVDNKIVVEAAVKDYVHAHRSALGAVNYSHLLTISVFSPAAMGQFTDGDYFVSKPDHQNRRPAPATVLRQSPDLDFLSINLYPDPHDPGKSLSALIDGLGAFSSTCHCDAKPFIVTETGEMQSYYRGLPPDEEKRFFGQSIDMVCKMGARGWLFWTWSNDQVAWKSLKRDKPLETLLLHGTQAGRGC